MHKRRLKSCFSIGIVVVGIFILAGNFFPPLTFMGCTVTPTRFRGQVIDQNGNPVPEALVSLSRHPIFFGKVSRSEIKADHEGNFSIFGIFGSGIHLAVSKTGYYPFYENANRKSMEESSKAYWGAYDHRASPSKTEMFRLWKPLAGEDLVYHRAKGYHLTRDGTPVAVNLAPDSSGASHLIEFRCWSQDDKPDDRQRYDWRFEVRVVKGGLKVRAGEYDFEAPIDGYFQSEEIDNPRMVNGQINQDWQSRAERDYFLRFDDDVFARAKIRIIPGGDHFVMFESALNPKKGSRNLSVVPK